MRAKTLASANATLHSITDYSMCKTLDSCSPCCNTSVDQDHRAGGREEDGSRNWMTSSLPSSHEESGMQHTCGERAAAV